MPVVWETVIFWLAFGLVSGWLLRYVYFSRDRTLPRKLRLVAIAIDVAALAMLFFPWLPKGRVGQAELGLVVQGVDEVTVVALLVGFTLVTLITRHWPRLAKAGAVSHILATVFLFWLMISLFPQTIRLTPGDTAPIIAALLLLANNVVLLLLWHEGDKNAT